MNFYYDLHIHSCLSPCGDRDMTPNNIVNMAIILGQDIIALTDHNSCKNCRATVEVGNRHGITVVPGMELCTSEEIHVICLFPDCDSAEAFEKYISSRMFHITNRPDKFGEQLILNSDDEVVGEELFLLITSADVSIENVTALCAEYGGVCFPAHIDRTSMSIFSSLGIFPDHLGFKFAELSYRHNIDDFINNNSLPQDITLLQSSDAHYLENMAEKTHTIDLAKNSAKSLINKLK